MDSYDSDSSGIEDEELGDYTDTGVLLGYAAEEVIEDSISHLGGWPVCHNIHQASLYGIIMNPRAISSILTQTIG